MNLAWAVWILVPVTESFNKGSGSFRDNISLANFNNADDGLELEENGTLRGGPKDKMTLDKQDVQNPARLSPLVQASVIVVLMALGLVLVLVSQVIISVLRGHQKVRTRAAESSWSATVWSSAAWASTVVFWPIVALLSYLLVNKQQESLV